MLNKALKVIRLHRKLKQRELAIRLNVSRLYLSEVECGKKILVPSC